MGNVIGKRKMVIVQVEALRKRRGYTKQKMAALLGVRPDSYSRWVNGRNNPSPLAQRCIERYLRGARIERFLKRAKGKGEIND